MKILSVQERLISLGSDKSNAEISFNSMTASAVVIEVKTEKGKFYGLGFSSYGRYGQGGLLRERFIPRLLNATQSDFIDEETGEFSMYSFRNVLMADEKAGGHGERSGAVGVLETAMWDAWSKSRGMPLWAMLSLIFGRPEKGNEGNSSGKTRIYASGGHYNSTETGIGTVADETKYALDQGYGWFKMKIGGGSRSDDRKRVNSAVLASGNPNLIAVDANCSFSDENSIEFLGDLDQLNLRWIEEPVSPLDFKGLNSIKTSLQTPIATGENIFSNADSQNLLNYGGLLAGRDILQMDIILSYGITEYIKMIEAGEKLGWSRRDFIPHAGHQVALHVSAGLGLGGHEVSIKNKEPFGGVSDDTSIGSGVATLSHSPGVGIERKPALYRYFDGMIS